MNPYEFSCLRGPKTTQERREEVHIYYREGVRCTIRARGKRRGDQLVHANDDLDFSMRPKDYEREIKREKIAKERKVARRIKKEARENYYLRDIEMCNFFLRHTGDNELGFRIEEDFEALERIRSVA